uniref:Uncharacterized protein n=1 Tax=Tanacetum cinerariifolium TaxID=118510 RepID=A0A6L2LF01_TANCI|nr:hypothetical protein [Tanacetum cinerariifolium]
MWSPFCSEGRNLPSNLPSTFLGNRRMHHILFCPFVMENKMEFNCWFSMESRRKKLFAFGNKLLLDIGASCMVDSENEAHYILRSVDRSS